MVNFGIVGFGLHAVKRLMPGFEKAKDCRVVALSRRDMARAQSSAREYNIPFAFDSAERLSQCPEVQAVLVATPNACHIQDVLVAVEHSKPVLCEKPMAINAGQCREMIRAARSAGVPLGVAHIFRFEESTARFREHIASGRIGKPIFARAEFSFPAKQGVHPRKWLNDAAIAGGGPIADIGVHCIDTLRFLLKDEVVAVSSRAVRDPYSGELEAAGALLLEFSRGTLGSVQVSFRADYRTPLEVIGEEGAISAEDALSVEAPVTIQLRQGKKAISTETVSNSAAYAWQVDAFAAAVEGRQEFPVPGEEGLKNQEILDAAYAQIRKSSG